MSWHGGIADEIRRNLDQIAGWKVVGDAIRVTTHCMYPSNGLVNVFIRGGIRNGVVSDDGGAVSEACSAGLSRKLSENQLNQLVSHQGLYVKNGVIRTREIPLERVPVAILLVANASKEVAEWLYNHGKIKRARNFPQALSDMLRSVFQERLVHKATVPGMRKQHTFANVVTLPDESILIVDPVANEASSINSRVVANLDVRQAGNPLIKQRLVYDDDEKWTPDNLSLLGMVGAPVIPFSESPRVIPRIALHD